MADRPNKFYWSLAPIILAGCSLLDPYNMIGRQAGAEATRVPTEVVAGLSGDRLGPSERALAFDFVWETIAERYHDPKLNGVDWKAVGRNYRPRALDARDDTAFWDALDRMTGRAARRAHARRLARARGAAKARRVDLARVLLHSARGQARGNEREHRLGCVVGGAAPRDDRRRHRRRAGGCGVRAPHGRHALRLHRALAPLPRAAQAAHRSAGDSKVPFTFERADGSRFEATRRAAQVQLACGYQPPRASVGIRLPAPHQWTLGINSRMVSRARRAA